MTKRIRIAHCEQVNTIADIEGAIQAARDLGATDASPVVKWYDPTFLIDVLVYEVPEDLATVPTQTLLARVKGRNPSNFAAEWAELESRFFE